jgi:hypothetical protein
MSHLVSDDGLREVVLGILEEAGGKCLTATLQARIFARANIDDAQQRNWREILLNDPRQRFACKNLIWSLHL